MTEHWLEDRQVFVVYRIEDNCDIVVHYTMKAAITAAEAYEEQYNEPCRIGRCFITGAETVAQRKENEKE